MAARDRRDNGTGADFERAAVWDGATKHRTRDAELDYDAELRLYNERFRVATGVGPADRVLDIGCGTGQTTREAARVAESGHVLGVDLSARMLESARRLSDEEGLHNVSYERADAQVHRFPSEHFDVAISRFGAMFFTDPVAAFRNIGGALRAGARLVLMVWQHRDRNEWASAIRKALGAGRALPDLSERGPDDPFSLADPATVRSILGSAGFAEINFSDVNEPVYYGRDSASAFDFVSGFLMTKELLTGLDASSIGRLRDVLTEHETDRGVWFDSRAWIVTARRGGGA
jgi:ubiquinone/menaquinone biosynthesis C-methylase UbiE